ncbi:MAG: HAMP domain-containing histidine kinase [Deltaproteobacteria bacterium]|nr:HAMP domain-containing histidine kinase [Deltaproteobacteria bacterium]
MHRRLFAAFAVGIVVTVGVGAGVMHALGDPTGAWKRDVLRVQRFTAGRFARFWDDPAERDALAGAVARDLDLDVRLATPQGATLFAQGRSLEACARPFTVPVARAGVPVGRVELCMDRHRGRPSGRRVLTALLAACGVLWLLAGRAARRFARPLAELARVVQDIGRGKLSARIKLPRRADGEIAVLAGAVNDMATRIEKQLEDQRQLLAAVSHELRSPLARARFLLELGREHPESPRWDELEGELSGIDALVGDLLANARMDFSALSLVTLEADAIARRALERAALPVTALDLEVPGQTLEGDATLLTTALVNLLQNAEKYGQGVVSLRVTTREAMVAFEVDDRGEGFAPGEETRVFEPFYRGPGARGQSGTGLGLALVRRIAEAHGGAAWAENLPGGGARVGLRLSALSHA